jgi:glutathione S-transferase
MGDYHLIEKNFNKIIKREKKMITLYRFGNMGCKCDPSPYCTKLNAYLQLTNMKFKTVKGADSLSSAPKGKLPYITDKGKDIGDSNLIIAYLKETYGDEIDAHLSSEERAVMQGFIAMMDGVLSSTLGYSRWVEDHNWVQAKSLFFGKMPTVLKMIVPPLLRRTVKKKYSSGDYKGFTKDELYGSADRALKALSDYLGDKKYFFGDKISTLDIAAYGILSQLYLIDVFTGGYYDHASKYDNLKAHTHHIYELLSEK